MSRPGADISGEGAPSPLKTIFQGATDKARGIKTDLTLEALVVLKDICYLSTRGKKKGWDITC